MAKALRDGDDGDAMGEHLGGHEVPQVVEPEAAHTGTAQVTDKRFGDPIRQPRRRTVVCGGEHEGGVGEHGIVRIGANLGPSPVFDQPLDGDIIDRDPIGAMCLRGPQHRSRRTSTYARAKPMAAWRASISAQRKPSSWLRRAPVEAANHK